MNKLNRTTAALMAERYWRKKREICQEWARKREKTERKESERNRTHAANRESDRLVVHIEFLWGIIFGAICNQKSFILLSFTLFLIRSLYRSIFHSDSFSYEHIILSHRSVSIFFSYRNPCIYRLNYKNPDYTRNVCGIFLQLTRAPYKLRKIKKSLWTHLKLQQNLKRFKEWKKYRNKYKESFAENGYFRHSRKKVGCFRCSFVLFRFFIFFSLLFSQSDRFGSIVYPLFSLLQFQVKLIGSYFVEAKIKCQNTVVAFLVVFFSSICCSDP